MMPDLPNVGWERDIESFREFFENPAFRTDGLKLYPTLVIRGTGLYELWKAGAYRNYAPSFLVDLVRARRQQGQSLSCWELCGLVVRVSSAISHRHMRVQLAAASSGCSCEMAGRWRACWRWCRPGCAFTASSATSPCRS